MRKIMISAILIAMVLLTAAGIAKADSGTKQVAGFLDGNILFGITDGTLTVLNKQIKLR